MFDRESTTESDVDICNNDERITERYYLSPKICLCKSDRTVTRRDLI